VKKSRDFRKISQIGQNYTGKICFFKVLKDGKMTKKLPSGFSPLGSFLLIVLITVGTVLYPCPGTH
jgi:hypothetical protein